VEQEKGAKEQKVGYRREKILSFLKEYAPASGN
jgi:hypothetical protein